MFASDLWYEIVQYTGPHGLWKYTCKTALKAAIDLMTTKKMSGDDMYTDTISMKTRFDINNFKPIKMSLKQTSIDCHFVNIIKFIKSHSQHYSRYCDTITGAIYSNMNISNKTRIYVFKYVVPELASSLTEQNITRHYTKGHHEFVSYILFETTWLEGRKSLKYDTEQYLGAYVNPRKYWLTLTKYGYSNTAKKAIEMYPNDIITADDDPEIVKDYITSTYVVSETHYLPDNPKILATFFKSKSDYFNDHEGHISRWATINDSSVLKTIVQYSDMFETKIVTMAKEYLNIVHAEKELKITVTKGTFTSKRCQQIVNTFVKDFYPKFMSVTTMKIVAVNITDYKILSNIYFYTLKYNQVVDTIEVAMICRRRLGDYRDVEQKALKKVAGDDNMTTVIKKMIIRLNEHTYKQFM